MQQPVFQNPNAAPLFPGAIPLESQDGFSHNVLADQQQAQMQGAMPQAQQHSFDYYAQQQQQQQPQPMAMQQPQPMPQVQQFAPSFDSIFTVANVNEQASMAAPAITNVGGLTHDNSVAQQNLRANAKITAADTFKIDPELWQLAQYISPSIFVPVPIRTTQTFDHTGDVYLLLLRARALGLSATQAFTDLFIINSPKTGEARIGLYVKTKEAVCASYGEWDTETLEDGSVRAHGVRYSSRQRKEVVFTYQQAAAMGMVKVDNRGNVVGCGKWADKLPEMMRARAIGRLLDALFPDVISGLVSIEELNDDEYERSLAQRYTSTAIEANGSEASTADATGGDADLPPAAENQSEQAEEPFDMKAAVTNTRRNKRTGVKAKTVKAPVTEQQPQQQAPAPMAENANNPFQSQALAQTPVSQPDEMGNTDWGNAEQFNQYADQSAQFQSVQ